MQIKSKALRAILSVLFVAAVAAMGTLFTDTANEWYQGLVKPALQPPGIVFGIAWTVLYALIAASLSLVAARDDTPGKTLWLHAGNGVLGVLWTYAFFQLHNPGGALGVLLMIIGVAVCLYSNVRKTNAAAAYLLIPYLVWLAFALYLNYEIAFLN
jgi:Tryptophan-rich sensory protein (mitochondrial benzodiazepine receptor homolog)